MVGVLIYSSIILIVATLLVLLIINILRGLKDFIENMNYVRSVSFKFSLGQKIFFWSSVAIMIITAIIAIFALIYNAISLIIK